MCLIENMTVDGSVHGDVIEIDNYDGSKSLIAGRYRGITPDQIFCGDCGLYLDLGGYEDIDKVVREHLADNVTDYKESKNAFSNQSNR